MVYLAAGYQTDFMSPNSPDNTKSTATEERANSTERSAFEQQLPALSDALSKWYLARLRRRAHQAAAGANLTPAALIAADRERVEKMIVDNATETGIKRTASMPALPPSNPQSKISLILPALIVVFQLLAAVSLFVPALSAMQIPAILCVVSLICAAMSLFTQLKLKKRLDDLRDETFGDEVNVEELERIDVIECIRYLFTRRDTIIEELREKEKAIVEFSDDIVISLDASLKITSTNPSSARLLGYSADEFLGHSIKQFILQEDLEKSEKALEGARGIKKESVFENRVKKKDGNSIDFFWQVEWSRTANGFFCIAHDITSRKNSERAKQEFVAMLSHDLRSPLGAIQGSLVLLKAGAMGALSEQAMTRISSAERIATQLIRLINDLLDIEKAEAGKFELVKEEFSLSEMLSQTLESVQTLADQKKITLEKTDFEAQIIADRDRLFRVLVNLLSNAIKFSPENSKVTVEAEIKLGFVEIRVSDQGRGIARADQVRIFDRFQQVEAADATIKGGSGLGLAICRTIVEKHGGTISVESEPGKGSTFKFKIPLKP
jgi:PAS domain S-box-containing protein